MYAASRYMGRVLTLLLLLAAAGGFRGGERSYAAPNFVVPAGLYFEATGQYVEGKFLDYWQEHGGLPVFGYPLTPVFHENGYMVQYFERTRFEQHPENAGTPYEVLLGQLGKDRLKADGVKVPPSRETPAAGALFFRETGFGVGGAFRGYWEKHGGLPQFGYPLSPEVQVHEGKSTLLVQYFERARFEWHPENAGTPYEVLLTRLGVERAAGLDPVLRDRWANPATPVSLSMARDYGRVNTLDTVQVSSDTAREVRVLGGDNRQYAAYRIEAGVPLAITVAGAPGKQSLVLYRDGQVMGALWAAYEAVAPVWGVRSGDPVWDGLYGRVGGYLAADAVDYVAPDEVTPVHGYRSPDSTAIWLRDHVHQSKGFKYFEGDVTSALDYFRTTQRDDGSLDDYLLNTIATPVFTDQIQVEADREYLYVEGVWTAWQATGNDAWLRGNIESMERALEHLWGNTNRWEPGLGLIKRAFTIDTWDFEQGSTEKHVRRSIDENTRWGIMHGDNTGAYQAARLLARMERHFGREDWATLWDSRAEALKDNLNKTAWNGHFYTHQVHLSPVGPTGVDESTQLSLSNAYALNRGTLAHEQAVEVLRTYQARRAEHGSSMFAEWYSIDPPFRYGFTPPGEYVNGGVMPLVGGELARGAFENGFEGYGVDILRRYYAMTERDGGSYLWYHADGKPGNGTLETIATDGWGSAAMLSAFAEGLAGIVDNGKLYGQVSLSPRWAATDRKEVSAALRYAATGAYFAYSLRFNNDGTINMAWGGKHTQAVRLHLLLPTGLSPREALVNGKAVGFSTSKVEGSVYLDAELPGAGQVMIR
jgi:hypothetical protein